MILQCRLQSGNNNCNLDKDNWSRRMILQYKLQSGNKDYNLEKDGWSKKINRTTKQSEHKVKLIIKLKAIEYKRASSTLYLFTPSARAFPSSLP